MDITDITINSELPVQFCQAITDTSGSVPSTNFIRHLGSRSFVWQYCLKGIGDKAGFSQCSLCWKEVKTTCNNTTGLINHLRKAHGIEIPPAKCSKPPSSNAPPSMTMKYINKFPSTIPVVKSPTVNVLYTVEEIVTHLLSHMDYSFDQIAMTPEFYVRGFKMPSHAKIVKAMLFKYSSTVEIYNKENIAMLKNTQGTKFALTLDETICYNGDGYFNINVHANTTSYTLGIVSNKVSIESLLQRVKEITLKYGLDFDHDIVGVTSNCEKGDKIFSANTSPEHVPSMPHAVHLAVCTMLYSQDTDSINYQNYVTDEIVDGYTQTNGSSDLFFNEEDMGQAQETDYDDEDLAKPRPKLKTIFHDVIKKVKRNIGILNSSTNLLVTLENQLHKDGINYHSLKTDCGITWTSIPPMFQGYAKYHPYLNNLLPNQNRLTNEEIAVVVQAHEPLTICKDLISLLCQKETTMYSSELAVIVALEQLNEINNDISISIAEKIFLFIHKRRNHKLMHLVNFLHNPSFLKNDVDQFRVKINFEDIINHAFGIMTRLRDGVNQEFRPSSPPDRFLVSPSKNLSFSERVHQAETLIKDENKRLSAMNMSNVNFIKEECYAYKYNMQSIPPTLSKLRSHLDTVLCNSMESERIFSELGKNLPPLRTIWGNKTLTCLAVCRSFLQKKEKATRALEVIAPSPSSSSDEHIFQPSISSHIPLCNSQEFQTVFSSS